MQISRWLAGSALATAAMASPGGAADAAAATQPPASVEAPAQPPAAPAAPAGDAQPDDGGLGEIVVTAQKRAQNLQDVPIAVSALTGPQLAAAGVISTADIKSAFAGVNIRQTGSQLYPYIRGIGTATNNVENPVAFYIDGIYYASQSDARRDLNDIDQVAVLKGPQGTLFGRNATAGVIQLTTKAPSHTFAGEFTAGIDNYATLRLGAYLTGPISDTLAYSLSAGFTKQFDGWGRNFTTGRDTYKIKRNNSVRGKLLWQPDDVTNVTIIGDYMDRLDNAGAYYRPLPGTQYSPLINYRDPGSKYNSYAGDDSISRFNGGGASIAVNRELGFGNLQAVTAYRRFRSGYLSDVDASPALGYTLDTSHAQGRTFSQELQLTSLKGSPIQWAVGAFYFHYRNALEPVRRLYGGRLFAPLPTSFVLRDINSSEVTNSIAPFGQLDFELFKDTRLTLGARWTFERRELNGTFSGIRADGVVVPAIIPPVTDRRITAKKPTWRIALDHKFSQDILGYVSYNRGFKSGGWNISNLQNPPYQPERLDAYEAGLKTELLDRRLRINGAIFYYQYQNVQVNQLIAGVNTIGNGAKAELYGLDMDVEARLAAGLRLTGGFEVLHTKFTNYPNAAISTYVPGGGVVVGTGNATGNRLPTAQKFNGNVALDYTTDVSFGRLAFNATYNYNGNYFLEADNVAKQGNYSLINLSVNWTAPGKALTVGAFVRNLLDKRVISYAAAFAGLGYVAAYDNPPRVYGLTGKLSF